ncbi:MAG: hypothetical protein AB1656_16710 [Candidatus Omnitrophota bacterium]
MKRKKNFCAIWNRLFVVALIVLLAAIPSAWSQGDKSDGDRIDKLEKENAQLRQMIEALQMRLDRVEGKKEQEPAKEEDSGKKKKKKDEKKEESAPSEADQVISATEAAADKSQRRRTEEYAVESEVEMEQTKGKKEEAWLPSLRGEQFQLGGRLQVDYYDREDETLLPSAFPENPGGTFKVDEFRLSLDADFKNKIRFHSDIDFVDEEGNTRLLESYIDFDELPLNSDLRVGLQPQFFRPARFTENYPLAGTAFWRGRDIGATWRGVYGPVYAYAAVSNGLRLNDKAVGEDDSVKAIGVDESSIDMDGGKEWSGGLGAAYDLGAYGKFDLLGFALIGDLDQNDLDFLQTAVPGYGQSNNDNREWFGGNLEYDIEEWDFFAQIISGRDGEMDRTGWYAELSRKFTFSGLKYLNSIRPLVRYGELDVDLNKRPYSADGSLTWDRRQWLFALISELTRNVNFRAEYALNQEETGGPDVQNNELLFQLEIVF